MKRRIFLSTCTAFLALAGQAQASSYADAIVAQLTQQGFADIALETTWLGRVRIVASRSDGVREIILNPNTGEILRDLWTAAEGQVAYSLVDPVGAKTVPETPSAQSEDNAADTGSETVDPSDSDGNDSQDQQSQDPPEAQTEDNSGGGN